MTLLLLSARLKENVSECCGIASGSHRIAQDSQLLHKGSCDNTKNE